MVEKNSKSREEAHHMDLSFRCSQSRFKHRQTDDIKKPSLDNIDFSCYILTDRRSLWLGRHVA